MPFPSPKEKGKSGRPPKFCFVFPPVWTIGSTLSPRSWTQFDEDCRRREFGCTLAVATAKDVKKSVPHAARLPSSPLLNPSHKYVAIC